MEDIISHFSYTFIKGSLNKKYPHPNALKLLFYNFGKTSINFFAQLTLAHMTMMSLHMTMTSSSCFGHLQTLPKPIKLRKTLVSPWTTIRVGSAASTLTSNHGRSCWTNAGWCQWHSKFILCLRHLLFEMPNQCLLICLNQSDRI